MADRPTHPGIYGIVHDESGRLYIGSGKDIHARWRKHKHLLRNGGHHSPHLQNAWNKYGEDAFRLVVLEACLRDEVALKNCEQHWLDRYAGKLFNAAKHADAAFGRSPTPEQREKQRRKMTGQRFTDRPSRSMKLSARAAIEIMHRFAAGELTVVLAAEYKVNRMTVIRIVKRETWGELQVDPRVDAVCRERIKTRNRMSNAKLSPRKAKEMRDRHAGGETIDSLAAVYGVGRDCATNAIKGLTWTEDVETVVVELPREPVVEPPKPLPKPPSRSYRRAQWSKPRPERVAVACVTCGKEMLLPPCFAKSRKTCSKECNRAWRSRNFKAMWQDPAIRESITESLRGRKPSEETNAKRAASIRKFHDERKKSATNMFDQESYGSS